MTVREMKEFHRILKEEYQRGYREGQSEEIFNNQHSETVDQLSVAEVEIQELRKTAEARDDAETMEKICKSTSTFHLDSKTIQESIPMEGWINPRNGHRPKNSMWCPALMCMVYQREDGLYAKIEETRGMPDPTISGRSKAPSVFPPDTT